MAPVGASEHQDLDRLPENHPVWDAGTVRAERVIRPSLGQEGFELLEDGLDDVLWFKRGHGGDAPSHREASRTPRMMEHPCPLYM